MGGSRLDHIARTTRPVALLSAVATLLGALFICQGPPADHHTAVPEAAGAVYSCPLDDGACGLLPTVSPAVLTAPPMDPPLDTGQQLPRADRPSGPGASAYARALPRAPGLHVLQVLRT